MRACVRMCVCVRAPVCVCVSVCVCVCVCVHACGCSTEIARLQLFCICPNITNTVINGSPSGSATKLITTVDDMLYEEM